MGMNGSLDVLKVGAGAGGGEAGLVRFGIQARWLEVGHHMIHLTFELRNNDSQHVACPLLHRESAHILQPWLLKRRGRGTGVCSPLEPDCSGVVGGVFVGPECRDRRQWNSS